MTTPDTYPIRIELPLHLRRLANLPGHEAVLDISSPITLRSILDALEARYPMLCGTIRDHTTHKRRAFLRFFVCQEDWTHHSPDTPLPEAVTTGAEPLLILGAIAGG